MELHYAGMYTSGIISADALHIAGLEVKDRQFEEATHLHSVPAYWEFVFDCVLGLAPPKAGDAQDKLHPLPMMVSQGLLDENDFALKLPLGDSDDSNGELTFGGINEDLFTDNLIRPLNKEIDPYIEGKWTVEARSVKLSDGKTVDRTLDGYAAFFDSGYPFSDQPLDVAREVVKALETKLSSSLFFAVPCKKRDSLPDLIYDLGGFDLTLTVYSYTTVKERDECSIWFDGCLGNKDENLYLSLDLCF